MDRIEVYRRWYEQERVSNGQMLGMLESVPAEARSDPRFQRAVVLAAHLAACRENWLDRMVAGGTHQVEWWPESAEIAGLGPRYVALEERWSAYLDQLCDDQLDVDFEFSVSSDTRYRWNIEGQIMQLVGHAFYHRGQIALLVEQLGGETVDTDYLYWAFETQPDRWKAFRGG